MACARSNEMVDESRASERRSTPEVVLKPIPLHKQQFHWSGLGALLLLISFSSRLIYLMSRMM